MRVNTARAHSLAFCDDCKSTHLNAPCGMSYAQRLRSVRLDSSVTPTKSRKNYYDDNSLTELFGGKSEAERHEQMMEETRGVGTASPEEIEAYPDLAYAQYCDNPHFDDQEVGR